MNEETQKSIVPQIVVNINCDFNYSEAALESALAILSKYGMLPKTNISGNAFCPTVSVVEIKGEAK